MRDITGQVQRTGTITANSVAMGVDEDGWGHLMSILSNQYSNRTLAVLREYACNAHDSHVEAGQTRPVEVTLPTDMNPSLIVRDFGVGLAKDRIFKVFGTYGASTKRDTNDQVGALGIGSKAAFTMGSQFIVRGVQDGFEATVLFALDDNHIGQMTLLGEGVTDDPDGVTVTLPVQDVMAMRREADDFFATWPKGSVLVNGEEPRLVREQSDVTKVNDAVWVSSNDQRVRVIMGTVAYPLDRHIVVKATETLTGDAERLGRTLSNPYRQVGVLFEVPIGAVNIAPSREALSDTPRTVKVIADVIKRAAADLTDQAQAEVNAAPSWFEASKVKVSVVERLGHLGFEGSDLTWNGKALGKVTTDLTGFGLVKRTYRSTKKVVSDPHKDVDFEDATKASEVLVLTGVPDPSKPVRSLKRFMEEHAVGQSVKRVLQTDNARGSFEWFSYGPNAPVQTMTLDEYKAALRSLRTANPSAGGVNEPHYTEGYMWEKDLEERTPLSELLSTGDPLMYFTSEEGEDHRLHASDPVVKAVSEGYTVITLCPTQSEKALLKRVPSAIHGMPLIRDYADKVVAGFGDDDRALLDALATKDQWAATSLRNWRQRLSAQWDSITNETFLTPFKVLADAEELVSLFADRLGEIQAAHKWASRSLQGEAEDVSNDIEVHWPLLRGVDSYYARRAPKALEHAVAYINSTSPIEVCAECETTVDDCECSDK